MTDIAEKRDLRVPLIGILLILGGVALFADRLAIVQLRWGKVFWGLITLYGAVVVTQAMPAHRRGQVFWGSLAFFAGIVFSLREWHVIHRGDFYFAPAMSVALGLAFLMMFLAEPKDLAVLVPSVIFLGFGVVYYLWWWDYVDWFDVRHYARTYWPLLLILWGGGIILRRRESWKSSA